MGPEREHEEGCTESLDELRDRLARMKRLLAERDAAAGLGGGGRRPPPTSLIDGNFLSLVFGGSLALIVAVSLYAFYNLYHAVLKRFPSKHTEL